MLNFIKSIVCHVYAFFILVSICHMSSLQAESVHKSSSFTISEWQFVTDKGLKEHSALEEAALIWQPIEVGKLLPQKYNGSVYGWYKASFFIEDAGLENPVIYIESIRGSDKVWLNNELIGQKGSLHSPWQLSGTQPQSLPRIYPVKKELLEKGTNTLVVKINTGIGHSWGAMFPGGTGITGRVLYGEKEELGPLYYKKMNLIIALDVIFVILGLVDIFIILILLKKAIRPFPEFKWLLLGSCLMMLGVTGHDIFFVYNFDVIPGDLSLFLSLLFIPYVNALYFWSQNKDVSTPILNFVSAIFLMVTFSIFIPWVNPLLKNILWQVWGVFSALFFAYALYSAIKGVRLKRVGSISQLVGVAIYIFSIRSQWIPFESFDHRNIQIGSLFFRYAILLAYFQQILSMRVSYKKLSKKMLSVSEITRQSVARELHDNIGQSLASAKLQLGLVKKTQDRKHYQLLEGELDDALSGMRRTIAGLHSFPVENDGLRKTLFNYGLALENKHGINVNINMDCDNQFDKPVHEKEELSFHHNIFRVIQELTNNSITHGQSTELNIDFHCHKHYITITVKDNGRGFKKKRNKNNSYNSGFGFISLKERIAILDGCIDIVSLPGHGTKADIRIPVN